MFIVPSGTLKTWLIESGRRAEAEQGIVLSDEQVAHLEDLRPQSAALTHYTPEERDAWAIFTAYTHAGHKPAGAADDIDPAVSKTRDSITAIAKASHAVASVVKDLPDTFTDLAGLADSLNATKGELQRATDACAGIARELERGMVQVSGVADRATGAAANMDGVLSSLDVLTDKLGQVAAKFPHGPVYVTDRPMLTWVQWLVVLIQLVTLGALGALLRGH